MTQNDKEAQTKLYNAVMHLSALNPWNFVDEFSTIVYERKDGKEVYLNVLGAAWPNHGFICNIGVTNYITPFLFAHGFPEMSHYVANSFMALWLDKKDVDSENLARIKELGLKFRGKGGWLNFIVTHERRTTTLPDTQDAEELAEIFETCYSILRSAIFEGKKLKIKDDELLRASKNKEGKWELKVVKFDYMLQNFSLDFDDKELIAKLKKKRKTKKPVYIMESCDDMPVYDSENPSGFYPLRISFFDYDTEELIFEISFPPQVSRAGAFSAAIAAFLEENRKPAKFISNNLLSAWALDPICNELGIEIEVEECEYDDIFNEFDYLNDLDVFNDTEESKNYTVHNKDGISYAIPEKENNDSKKTGKLLQWPTDDSFTDFDNTPKKTQKRKHQKSNKVYTISVSLYTGCYRHIKISGDTTLEALHNAIQSAFEFNNDHMYAFFMDNKAWSRNDAYYSPYDNSGRSAAEYNIGEVLGEKQKFLYLFDFGDEWHFNCKVLKITDGTQEDAEIVRSIGEAPPQYPDFEDE